ncbi:hypothetical protein WISP_127662 [Willisornis vidua]|uniref:Uncharacterized protein n=1 Tax=Willisornis vidua TaxID=1566151 RepID=A0ABQ9CQF6_9PASS|nr:hypothetical protein WISP_127662 [Willisornis vidua]
MEEQSFRQSLTKPDPNDQHAHLREHPEYPSGQESQAETSHNTTQEQRKRHRKTTKENSSQVDKKQIHYGKKPKTKHEKIIMVIKWFSSAFFPLGQDNWIAFCLLMKTSVPYGPKGIIRYVPKPKLIHVIELNFIFCQGHKTVALIYHINFVIFISAFFRDFSTTCNSPGFCHAYENFAPLGDTPNGKTSPFVS